jgi:hypothetical protein
MASRIDPQQLTRLKASNDELFNAAKETPVHDPLRKKLLCIACDFANIINLLESPLNSSFLSAAELSLEADILVLQRTKETLSKLKKRRMEEENAQSQGQIVEESPVPPLVIPQQESSS